MLDPSLTEKITRIALSPYLIIASDYDGTLAPITERPEQAKLIEGAAGVLLSLALLPQTRMTIISGRSRDNLLGHSRLTQPIELIGSHGAELPNAPNTTNLIDLNMQIDRLQTAIEAICNKTLGAWIERKTLGLAVHVRQVDPQEVKTLRGKIYDVLKDWSTVHVTEGKAVLDMSFSRATKGDAIRWLRTNWGSAPRVIYFGDDVTDEAAFSALEPIDIGVKVGPGPTQAAFRVSDESDTLSVLSLIMEVRKIF